MDPNIKPVPEELKFKPFPKEIPPSRRSRYSLVFFLSIILLFLFGVSVFILVWGNGDKIQSLRNLTPEMLVTTEDNSAELSDARQILSDFQSSLGTASTISEFKYNDWIMPNKTKSFIKGFSFSLAKEQNTVNETQMLDSYGTGSDSANINNLTNDLISKSEKYFLSHGFSVNVINSSDFNQKETVPENELDINKAYEKNGIFCVSSFDKTSFTYANFYCGIADTEQNNLQNTVGKELEPLLNPTLDPNTQILVQRVVGDFAVGGVGDKNGGGAGFYAKKVNGKWEKIIITQNGLPCFVARKYNMPQELSANCTEQ